MISSFGEEYPSTKKESGDTSSSSSLSWLRAKDPRIVRASRHGGKDRHIKVFTARGLRDRRVRLSASTANQIYDLQVKLGLNQTSKVVDWLLDAAKQEIDDLPPLQLSKTSEFMSSCFLPSFSKGINVNSNIHFHHDYLRTGDSVELSRSNSWVGHCARKYAQDMKEKAADGIILQGHVAVPAAGLLPYMGFQLHPSNFSSSTLPQALDDSATGYSFASASVLPAPPPFSLPFGSQLFLSTLQPHHTAASADHFNPKGKQILSLHYTKNLLPIASHSPFYTASQAMGPCNFSMPSKKLVNSQRADKIDLLPHNDGEFPPK
ncbi:hypothetical protein Nepgr_003778 [Nepenthes gracilis]|uniref:TCP domain-containing protein n=1 Tax=Nepenthes gracilis TaxID=150966 RepID=A0AAD3S0A6_NEPGR|nr:hypothetical protein Nepgr_003778 [Nepenthes gracilis]